MRQLTPRKQVRPQTTGKVASLTYQNPDPPLVAQQLVASAIVKLEKAALTLATLQQTRKNASIYEYIDAGERHISGGEEQRNIK